MLEIGTKAPDFDLFTDKNNWKTLHDIPGTKIIFFFPKAFTPGCTKQSCSLQNSYSDLKKDGITEVIGISLDKVETLQKFAKQYNLEYIFISDQNTLISKSYAVYRKKFFWKFADRDTFIVNNENLIVSILKNGLTGRKSELGLKNHGLEVMNEYKQLESN